MVFALVVATFSGPEPARGFSVSVHEKITDAALQQIDRCAKKPGSRWAHLSSVNETARTLLNACNVKQDEIFRKFALWHFYANGTRRSGEGLPGYKLAGDTTFDAYYARLVERMDAATEPREIYAAAGALLHFVQDVAVPAHVLPIFHPTLGFPKIVHGDSVDNYKFQAPKVSDADEACAALLDEPKGGPAAKSGAGAILAATAQDTFASLKSPLPSVALEVKGAPEAVASLDRTWGLFWGAKPEDNGFARYGCEGHDRFSKETFTCEGAAGKTRVTVKKDAYDAFAEARHKAAVDASVRIIAAAARRAANVAPAASVELSCPVAVVEERRAFLVCDDWIAGKRGRRCPPASQGH